MVDDVEGVGFIVGGVEYRLGRLLPDEFIALIEKPKNRGLIAYPAYYCVFGDDIRVWPNPPSGLGETKKLT